MKWSLMLISMLFITSIQAQGLEEKFDEQCNCWEVSNHYDNGQVSSIHHENAKRQRDGVAKLYNTTGTLISEEQWSNGRLDGKTTKYHSDGSVYMEANYENGNKVGTWMFKEPDGTPLQEIHYTGQGDDARYIHYYAGVKFMEQVIENGKLVTTDILNQELYDIVQEESQQTVKP